MRTMKDSGIAWIGEIPEEWTLSRIQNSLQEINEKNSPVRTSQILSLVKDRGVMLYEEKGNIGNKAKEDITEYKIAYPHSLVINSMNILIGSIGISKYFGCVSPVYYIFNETKNSDIRFINYIFNTNGMQKELRKYANGILEIRLRVSANDIFKQKIPLPSKTEQSLIADYLDTKCAEIDRSMELVRQGIDKLKEYKKSVITEAVTKGLDPDVPMKDSGVPWIGEIPEEWEIKKFKDIFIFGRGLPITKENLVETGIPVLSYGQIHSKNNPGTRVNTELFRFVPQTYLDTHRDSLLDAGDIIFADTSEDYEGIGNNIHIDLEQKIFAGYHTIICHPVVNLQTKYFPYLFQTDMWRSQLRANVSGIKVFSITQKLLRETSVLIPPFLEQRRIADYLDAKCAEIDRSMELVRQGIDKLKEYKKSVITEAVTKGLDPDVPMKDSGVPWIGDTPSMWVFEKLKNFFTFEKGINAQKYTKEYIGLHQGDFPVYSGQTENDGIMGRIDSFDYDIPNCIFTTTVGAKVMSAKIISGKFSLSQNCLIMKPINTSVIVEYFLYVLIALFEYEKSLIPTYMQPSLRISDLLKYSFFIPPDFREQKRIADYLDAKCAEIDALIAQKQTLLDKLVEYKKSLIFECVTGKREVAE